MQDMYTATCFGGLQIILPNGAVAQLQTHRARALFLFLILNRDRMVHREVLCAALWPETSEASARSQLRKTLWRIRTACAHPGTDLPTEGPIRIAEHQVGLDTSRIDVDLWRFEDCIRSLELKSDGCLAEADAAALLAAVDLNRDTFAAGIFDDWCLAEQEVLREARLAAMERLIGYHRAHAHHQQAIHWAQRALALDPIREHLHHAIMDSRCAMGDRASAIRQYHQCAAVLRREIGLHPSRQISILFHNLTAGDAGSLSERTELQK
jgi:DNA-binding SARP family transcriptional activator